MNLSDKHPDVIIKAWWCCLASEREWVRTYASLKEEREDIWFRPYFCFEGLECFFGSAF